MVEPRYDLLIEADGIMGSLASHYLQQAGLKVLWRPSSTWLKDREATNPWWLGDWASFLGAWQTDFPDEESFRWTKLWWDLEPQERGLCYVTPFCIFESQERPLWEWAFMRSGFTDEQQRAFLFRPWQSLAYGFADSSSSGRFKSFAYDFQQAYTQANFFHITPKTQQNIFERLRDLGILAPEAELKKEKDHWRVAEHSFRFVVHITNRSLSLSRATWYRLDIHLKQASPHQVFWPKTFFVWDPRVVGEWLESCFATQIMDKAGLHWALYVKVPSELAGLPSGIKSFTPLVKKRFLKALRLNEEAVADLREQVYPLRSFDVAYPDWPRGFWFRRGGKVEIPGPWAYSTGERIKFEKKLSEELLLQLRGRG
ncbi:MAG: hypothetical protein N2Z70_01090 [Bdellovibrionaceae bacterium]|nr:hypothetical protein [Pseudobdellovibrionaceae bacterium]